MPKAQNISKGNTKNDNNNKDDNMIDEEERIINASKNGDLEYLKSLLLLPPPSSSSSSSNSNKKESIRNARCSIGCSALHWAAGSNQLSIVHFLLSPLSSSSSPSSPSVSLSSDQHERIFTNVDLPVESKLAKGRTPLTYACRNGHLEVVKALIEIYGANPHIKARQGVTAFQLAIWQNRFEVCKYLVEGCGESGIIPSEDINDFGCGAIHWLGIVPFKRANFDKGDDNAGDKGDNTGDKDDTENHKASNNAGNNNSGEGKDLMPLAKWLTKQPNMNVHAKQNQGHTVLHKAAWGGHLELVRYLHEEYDMYDDNTDIAGNYAADLCDMMNTERHKKVALYLRRECSLERLESFKVLGLEGKLEATFEEIRRAYLERAKVFHPDAQLRRGDFDANENENNNNTGNIQNSDDMNYDFDHLRKAYEHLTLGGGIATKQHNPAHSINLLLEMQASTSSSTYLTARESSDDNSKTIPGEVSDENDLFKARLLAVLLEYGDKGLNLANIPKKWDQVWPTIPFNSLFEGKKRKNGELLKMIKERAGDVVRIRRVKPPNEERSKSNKGAILIIPRHISRNDVLKYASDKLTTRQSS
jgi:ankyrin repeat protein